LLLKIRSAHPVTGHDILIEHHGAGLGNRAGGQFRIAGEAYFPDDEDVERATERPGNFIGDGHSTPRQPQYNHIRFIPVLHQFLGQSFPGVRSVPVDHDLSLS